MADLETAFGTSFDEIDSYLDFDIVRLYQPINGVDNKKYIGVVTLKTNYPITSFKYRVFTGAQDHSPFQTENQPKITQLRVFPMQQQDMKPSVIIEGTVEKTNNLTFTFPIPSIDKDYFVIISPFPADTLIPKPDVSNYSESIRGLAPSKQLKETFSIFYPMRILKERRRRGKKVDAPPAFVFPYEFKND